MKTISKHITVKLLKFKKRKNLASDQREMVEFSKKAWKSEASRMTSSKFSKKSKQLLVLAGFTQKSGAD